MQMEVLCGPIQASDADAIVLGLFEGAPLEGAVKAVDEALGGAVADLIASGDFGGKAQQVAVLYPRGAIPARRVILVGLGAAETFDADAVRQAAAVAARRARELQVNRLASVLHGVDRLGADGAAQATVEGSELGLYSYHGQKTAPPPSVLPQSLELMASDEAEMAAAAEGAARGQVVAAAVTLTRDLVNLPPNICTPAYLAQVAVEVAQKSGLRVEVLERKQMEALKMGALLAVAQGSDTPPRFIVLEHNADRAADLKTVVLVGKGVTFDTGGYDLKTREGMANMKVDMAGAAAVIGAMQAVAALDLPLHVVGLAPAADNMIGSRAYRPQEVITASNGTTIEITSTDAEGRLLLADALVYAARFQPAAVVDIATLTGACMTALGVGVAAGLFSNDDALRDALLAASARTAERLWPLPLFPEYEKMIESDTADVANSSREKFPGVGASATFLKRFVSYPWAHIDMAGMAVGEKEHPYIARGKASAFGVRLLIEFVRGWQ